MNIKQKPVLKGVSLMLDVETAAELRRLAKQYGQSISLVARDILRNYLRRSAAQTGKKINL